MNRSLEAAAKRGSIVGDLSAIDNVNALEHNSSIPEDMLVSESGPGGINWTARRLKFIGVHPDRGYVTFAYAREDGGVQLLAGCRNYSLPDAREHWGPRNGNDDGWFIDACRVAESWVSEYAALPDEVKRDRTPDRIPLEYVVDYMGKDGRQFTMFRNWLRFEKGVIVNSEGKLEQ